MPTLGLVTTIGPLLIGFGFVIIPLLGLTTTTPFCPLTSPAFGFTTTMPLFGKPTAFAQLGSIAAISELPTASTDAESTEAAVEFVGASGPA